ncbi:hypothetical protein [Acaryochloris sp. 'Moss Beach']|uniref:hypothetical protein n=1 Tax=Acaryochloris sp. 'Moss Beach' TaxID=2740837 RepID=UPI001F19AD33|nr:hypothetical protein [Acaryochloris sp. 'Moss Beach']
MTQSPSIKILSLPPILGATVITAVLLGVAPAQAKDQSSSESNSLQEQLRLSSPFAPPQPIGQLPTDATPSQTAPVFTLPDQPATPAIEAPSTPEEQVESAPDEATPNTGAPGEPPTAEDIAPVGPGDAPAAEEATPAVPGELPATDEAAPDTGAPGDVPATDEAAPDTGAPGDVPTETPSADDVTPYRVIPSSPSSWTSSSWGVIFPVAILVKPRLPLNPQKIL